MMEQFKQLNVTEALALLEQNEHAVLLDNRDIASYQQSHAQNALHLSPQNILTFCEEFDFDRPILVICYHGISSQGVAQYFVNYGFESVYSISGGFAAWQQAKLPIE